MFITEQTDRLGRRDFPAKFSNPGCDWQAAGIHVQAAA